MFHTWSERVELLMNISFVISLFACIGADFQYNTAVAAFGLFVARAKDGKQIFALVVFLAVSMLVDICTMALDDQVALYSSRIVFGITYVVRVGGERGWGGGGRDLASRRWGVFVVWRIVYV
jgi:hypothetical protein